jgi:hypothetical protein
VVIGDGRQGLGNGVSGAQLFGLMDPRHRKRCTGFPHGLPGMAINAVDGIRRQSRGGCQHALKHAAPSDRV